MGTLRQLQTLTVPTWLASDQKESAGRPFEDHRSRLARLVVATQRVDGEIRTSDTVVRLAWLLLCLLCRRFRPRLGRARPPAEFWSCSPKLLALFWCFLVALFVGTGMWMGSRVLNQKHSGDSTTQPPAARSARWLSQKPSRTRQRRALSEAAHHAGAIEWHQHTEWESVPLGALYLTNAKEEGFIGSSLWSN